MKYSHLTVGCLAFGDLLHAAPAHHHRQDTRVVLASHQPTARNRAGKVNPDPVAAANRAAAARVAELMADRYVIPEAGRRAAAVVRAAAGRGAYDRLRTDALLASALATDLRTAVQDGHLAVFVDRALAASILRPPAATEPDQAGAHSDVLPILTGDRVLGTAERRAYVLADNKLAINLLELTFEVPAAVQDFPGNSRALHLRPAALGDKRYPATAE